MKKIFLLFVPIMLSFSVHGQKIEKFLTKEQKDSIEQGLHIFLPVDKSMSKSFLFEGFQGVVEVLKTNGKIYYDFVGESFRYNEEGKLAAKYIYSQSKDPLVYQEFDSNEKVIFDWVFEYKWIDGEKYELFRERTYYEPNILKHEGNRFLKIIDKKGRHKNNGTSKKYGVWNFYDINGQLIKTKDYGKL